MTIYPTKIIDGTKVIIMVDEWDKEPTKVSTHEPAHKPEPVKENEKE